MIAREWAIATTFRFISFSQEALAVRSTAGHAVTGQPISISTRCARAGATLESPGKQVCLRGVSLQLASRLGTGCEKIVPSVQCPAPAALAVKGKIICAPRERLFPKPKTPGRLRLRKSKLTINLSVFHERRKRLRFSVFHTWGTGGVNGPVWWWTTAIGRRKAGKTSFLMVKSGLTANDRLVGNCQAH